MKFRTPQWKAPSPRVRIVSALVLAATLTSVGVAFASTDLNPAQVGASSTTFTQECKGDENLTGTEVLWHFVLTQTTDEKTGTLTAEFDSAGTRVRTPPDKKAGGTLQWNIITPTDDILLGASTDADGGLLNLSHVCRAASTAAEAHIVTEIHEGTSDSGSPKVVPLNSGVPLGSKVHDSATLTTTPELGTLPSASTVSFYFYEDGHCDDSEAGVPGGYCGSADFNVSGQSTIGGYHVDPALPQGPLEAGQYSYRAFFVSGDQTVVLNATSECEPFEVEKGDTKTRTEVHDATHADITWKGVRVGSYVHDKAFVEGDPATAIDITGSVEFTFYTNGTCQGDGADSEAVGLAGDDTAESSARQINAAGAYSYKANYLGDANYNPSTGECEPFSVFQPGKTMGFWGNKNGQERILGNGGYAANSVDIGRGAVVDTQAESLKILPLTLNACGKGTPFIFTVGAQTASNNCTLATGVNIGSLNTLAAQTLALGYNIKLVPGYTGQPLSQLGCTPVGSLSASSTVNQAFTAAVALINGSASGGGTTQTQIGAMNTLLGCLNAEA